MNSSVIFDLAVRTLAEYGLLEKGWKVAWDNGKRRAGACHYGTRTISLSRYILPTATDAEVRETILHEVAHALTPGHSHDGVWRAKLIEMGGTGARTHKMDTPKGRYELVCERCGVIGHRHQAQGRMRAFVGPEFKSSLYAHVGCGGRIRLNDTKGMGVTLPAQPKPVQVPVVEVFATASSEPAGNPARVCFCGCNGTTKGGSYLPGHDARHVSEVFAGWLANRYDITHAAAELPTQALRDKLAKRIAAYAAKHYKD